MKGSQMTHTLKVNLVMPEATLAALQVRHVEEKKVWHQKQKVNVISGLDHPPPPTKKTSKNALLTVWF